MFFNEIRAVYSSGYRSVSNCLWKEHVSPIHFYYLQCENSLINFTLIIISSRRGLFFQILKWVDVIVDVVGTSHSTL